VKVRQNQEMVCPKCGELRGSIDKDIAADAPITSDSISFDSKNSLPVNPGWECTKCHEPFARLNDKGTWVIHLRHHGWVS
jgi:hypothetical protein